jgi:hypothetical protein
MLDRFLSFGGSLNNLIYKNGLRLGILVGISYSISIFYQPFVIYIVTLIVNFYDLPYINVLIARNLIYFLVMLFSITAEWFPNM